MKAVCVCVCVFDVKGL